jgi:hypothetical protein
MVITVTVTTVVWLAVTFLTPPEPDAMLASFYRRVRPGGPGWVRISRSLGLGQEPIPGGKTAWANWVAGIVAVYGTLFGIGKIIFGYMVNGIVLLAIALVAFLFTARSFREEEPEIAELLSGEGVGSGARLEGSGAPMEQSSGAED